MKDYYKVLGVPEQATGDEIKTAYRKLAKKYHPDVVKGDKEKETQMYEIQEAYQCLGDKEKRKNYDLSRRKKHTNFKPGFKPQTGKETKNVHGHPDSGRNQFEQFFGFQPGKGVDSYRGKNHTAAKPEGPIKPEEMFASFFGKQEEKGGRQ